MISICIPTYNRCESVISSFIDVLDCEVISEIIIVDDYSDQNIFNDLKLNLPNSDKIKIYRNDTNIGAFLNKKKCVSLSLNDWVILFDSDNKLTIDYIKSIPIDSLSENTFYLPSLAKCESKNLDYRVYSDYKINLDTFCEMLTSNDVVVYCMLNTGNYLVNKHTYLKSIASEPNLLNPFAVDCVYQLFLCYKYIDGFSCHIVSNMWYYHALHNNSYYIKYSKLSEEFLLQLKNKVNDIRRTNRI